MRFRLLVLWDKLLSGFPWRKTPKFNVSTEELSNTLQQAQQGIDDLIGHPQNEG